MSSFKYSYAMSLADIDKATVSLARRATSLREDTHKVLVSLLAVWHTDGDARKITARMTAIVEGEKYYGQSIVDWAANFAGFEWSKDGGFKYTNTTIELKSVQDAKAKPFYEFAPAKEPKAYILDEKLTALIKTARGKAKKNADGDSISPDLLAALEKALSDHADNKLAEGEVETAS